MHPEITYELAVARVADLRRAAEERSHTKALRPHRSRLGALHALSGYFRRSGKAPVATSTT